MEPLCSQAHLSYTAFSHGSVNFLSVSHKCQIFQALPHYVLKPFQLSLFFLILNTSVLFFVFSLKRLHCLYNPSMEYSASFYGQIFQLPPAFFHLG